MQNFTKRGFTIDEVLKRNYKNLDKATQNKLLYAIQPNQKPIIKNSQLKVNGHKRFDCSSDETNLLRPYTFFNNSITNGINVYNFDLYPMQKQPSGSINFSFLNDINLLLDYNKVNDTELTIKIFTISYNYLRIMSGYGGLGFDTI